MMSKTLEARGRVVEVRDGVAEVRLPVASGCQSCRAQAVCGSGREKSVHVAAASGLAVGDNVSLQVGETSFSLGAVIGYLLPALTLLLGAALFSFAGDAAAVLGATIGLVSGILLVRFLDRRFLADRLQPVATVTCSPPSLPGENP
ncbi:MAG: SoxR reducing system RseC family protein [Candidatus Accumulibacter sp. UW26]|jgi:sigma-E factor negative regulatory protein RseC